MAKSGPGRELVGYGGRPPHPHWPGGARVALQFVLNVEEGSESCILHGDAQSEAYLHELPGRPPRRGERDWSVESLYEYGARAGAWRLLALFAERNVPLTVFATGQALELNPPLAQALSQGDIEVAGHGYRWLDYHFVPEDEERRHIQQTLAAIAKCCNKQALGWYTGRQSANTRRLVQEAGLLYSSDCYNDDLPYWHQDLLMLPYSLVTNDMRYLLPNCVASGEDFFALLKDAFDCLWQEGATAPKMMSVGLHGRISGHPARALALVRFLSHVQAKGGAWICKRQDIARHWQAHHPSRP
ncbi:polysaccharide deacetylase family protein [Gallaecimonas kandeliae]|uniref:polysaccharide deacetylase family protein n=1 Tax=Gallaecimonas kandeliae TaxID=3029055 RepID=UPI002647B3F9|nr:polysaccharide deacetylase family protein [Gallaecimonas kandeliae]WKE67146.1 polysaccharide deacetylase family protein [Gallaecimonas kandeliae]